MNGAVEMFLQVTLELTALHPDLSAGHSLEVRPNWRSHQEVGLEKALGRRLKGERREQASLLDRERWFAWLGRMAGSGHNPPGPAAPPPPAGALGLGPIPGLGIEAILRPRTGPARN